MSNNNLRSQERIAREAIHDPLFLGTDGEGAAHFWSSYHRTIVVVEPDGTKDSFHIDETPYDTLSGWASHVKVKRGWAGEPNIVSGFSDALSRAVEQCLEDRICDTLFSTSNDVSW